MYFPLNKILRILCLIMSLAKIAVIFGKHDFNKVPGHLQKLGTGRPVTHIDSVSGFPSVNDFFLNYVHKMKPLKMAGAVKGSYANVKWTDEYFLSLSIPSNNTVLIETKKKENRKEATLDMHFQKFVRRYNTTDEYMVQSIPEFLGKDIPLPLPLNCEELYNDKLTDAIIWFSSGGTKSVLHTDSVENLNCLYHGEKEFYMIDPAKYEDKVDIDHPEGAYSGVDVDRVDFEKYPGLSEVEYVLANLSAGDCLYIPYKWIHQVRSYQRNIAVNIWWDHYSGREVDISKCDGSGSPITLDKVAFQSVESYVNINTIRDYFYELTKKGQLPVDTYYGMFLSDMPIVDEEDTEGHKKLLKEVSSVLDKNSDRKISREEVEKTTDEEWNSIKYIMEKLQDQVEELEAKMEDHQRQQSFDYELNDLLPVEDEYESNVDHEEL